MIRVFAHRQGGYYRFYATGHANYCPGEDIVCAGVSALVGALTAFGVQSTIAAMSVAAARQVRYFLPAEGGWGEHLILLLAALHASRRPTPIMSG